MKNLERRSFIKKAAVAAAGTSALLSACGSEKNNEAPAIHTRETFEWKMVTAWPPHFPIIGEGADKISELLETLSEGRLKIHVYGGGELVPPLECFDAVSQGSAEIAHSASYYWAGKAPAAQFFSGIPFGMKTDEVNSWFLYGGGLELWHELYAKFNLIAFPAGNTGAQMGGWFNKKINSISDLQGLKIRMPGIGGKVITKAGATAILSPGGEIYTNLERGVIDATEWIGPYHDYLMGFNKIAKYYYYPSWSEATGVLELIVNKSAYEKLPKDLQLLIKTVSDSLNTTMLAEFNAKNAEYLAKIKSEGKNELVEFPKEVIEYFKSKAKEVITEITSKDEMSRKVYASYKAFQDKIQPWSEMVIK